MHLEPLKGFLSGACQILMLDNLIERQLNQLDTKPLQVSPELFETGMIPRETCLMQPRTDQKCGRPKQLQSLMRLLTT